MLVSPLSNDSIHFHILYTPRIKQPTHLTTVFNSLNLLSSFFNSFCSSEIFVFRLSFKRLCSNTCSNNKFSFAFYSHYQFTAQYKNFFQYVQSLFLFFLSINTSPSPLRLSLVSHDFSLVILLIGRIVVQKDRRREREEIQ